MHWYSLVGVAFTIGASAIAGCYSGIDDSESPRSNLLDGEAGKRGGTDGPANGSTSTSPSTPASTGIPCEVDALLAARCRSCHGTPLMAPMPLISYEDLAAPSKSDGTKSVAVAALERMTSSTSPMPPSGGLATEAELAAFRTWIEAGLPRGTCGAPPSSGGGASSPGGTTSPPTPLQSVCSSNKTWGSDQQGTQMNPGRACITCHERESDDGVIVRVGGTVYPTLREPDLCYGIDGDATPTTVVITDAAGKVFTMPVGPTGNFSLRGSTAVQMPFRAKVVRNGIERQMNKAQSTGDCNSCHTETGANGAPGRILLP